MESKLLFLSGSSEPNPPNYALPFKNQGAIRLQILRFIVKIN